MQQNLHNSIVNIYSCVLTFTELCNIYQIINFAKYPYEIVNIKSGMAQDLKTYIWFRQ